MPAKYLSISSRLRSRIFFCARFVILQRYKAAVAQV
jgi:hypothetical protein